MGLFASNPPAGRRPIATRHRRGKGAVTSAFPLGRSAMSRRCERPLEAAMPALTHTGSPGQPRLQVTPARRARWYWFDGDGAPSNPDTRSWARQRIWRGWSAAGSMKTRGNDSLRGRTSKGKKWRRQLPCAIGSYGGRRSDRASGHVLLEVARNTQRGRESRHCDHDEPLLTYPTHC